MAAPAAPADVAQAAARRLGLAAEGCRVWPAGARRAWLLAPDGPVARLHPPGAAARAAREVTVAAALAAADAPVVPPSAGNSLLRVAGWTVTLWPLVGPGTPAGEADVAAVAATLAQIRPALDRLALPLPPLAAAVARCAAALAAAPPTPALDLLARALDRWGDAATAEPATALHGDLHPGQFTQRWHGRWRLLDWEDACRGPAAWDIAGLPPPAWPPFAAVDRALVRRCARLRSAIVASWCCLDATPTAAMQDAAAYHLSRVRRCLR